MNAAPLVTGLGTIAGIGAAQVAWVVWSTRGGARGR